MKLILDNLILSIALMASVLVHTVFLLLHFVAGPAADMKPVDPGLEVILVNAKHDKSPSHAQALAQSNLDGGGASDEGRAKSPLPDLSRSENGENVVATKQRIEQLEEQQKKLLEQFRKTPFSTAKANDAKKPDDTLAPSDGQEKIDSTQALARTVAEIAQTIEDQNKRPRKTFITPSTKAVGYAVYYKALQKKVEDVGTLNFPQKNGHKLYGELIIYIPIFQDGSIYEKDGGPRIEKSSGSKALDAAALRIVRRAAPFGNFPPNMRSRDKDDIWVVITRFKFTRDQQLETELRGRGK